MYQELIDKKAKLAVIGLGYVGLPIALEFARKISVIGFDINAKRVEMMRNSIDPSNELEKEAFDGCDIVFTDSLDVLREAKFFIVAVPTPVDEHNVPDLVPVIRASETVGKVVKKGDYVVFESTVYPGCTEDDCQPVMEKLSGLKAVTDFKLGYSPERINPGDKKHTLATIVKVVSGCDAESLETIAKVYELVVTAGVHRASSIKVAEAAKIIENTQRDLNIALMNELSIIFDMMNINTYEVLEAAGTKWNFLKFQPGLVGGHCIGVDPYYLTYKASPLIADWPNRPRQKVDFELGKPSLTTYSVIAHDAVSNISRVELHPLTGRSHQLRVHMQAIGHPILGDDLYADSGSRHAAARLLLHATELTLPHPISGKQLRLESPPDF